MNAQELTLSLVKSLAKPPSGGRLEQMVSAATRRELSAMRKLSRPMDEATAGHLATQHARHKAWAPYL